MGCKLPMVAIRSKPLLNTLESVATVPALLYERAEKNPDGIAYYFRSKNRSWETMTWLIYWQRVARIAHQLTQRGVQAGERIAIMAPSSVQWDILDKATLLAGAIVVGIDHQTSVAQQQYILRHSEASVLIVKDAAALNSIGADLLKALRIIIVLNETSAERVGPRLIHWVELLAGDTSMAPATWPSADDPAVLIYTSGTTGSPKGILFTHRQLIIAVRAIVEGLALREEDCAISWLPLANLFQRMINLCCIGCGAATYFVDNPAQILEEVAAIRPTFFIGVPRFYEKLYQRIQDTIARLPEWRRALVDAALRHGGEFAHYQREKLTVPWLVKLRQRLLDALVLAKLRSVMGGRMRFMITGSAPAAKPMLDFFYAIGLPLLEAYGMSENVVPMAFNRPHDWRPGSVGKPLAINEIESTPDGELLVCGPGLCKGYYKADNPAERFTEEGFFITGDNGYFDADGFLYLRGRTTDLIKTSTGRRLSPLKIEAALREIPLIDQALVVGNNRKELTAIITVDRQKLAEVLPTLELQAPAESDNTLLEPLFRLLKQDINAIAGNLAPYERVRGCLVVTGGFSVEGGQLTTNLKRRRAAIERLYAAQIDALYAAIEQQRRGGQALQDPLLMAIP